MKVDKKNIYIILFSIWVTISGVLFAVGNNFIKIIGAISLLLIVFLILIGSTLKINNQNNKKINIDSIAGYIKVACPYNGRVLSIKASVGDYVKKGDTIVVLDALKMETPIEAPEDGIVAYIGVEEKSTVERETVLFSLY